MTTLKDTISEHIKNAMKAKDVKKLSVLRMMLSEIKYAQAQTNLHAEIDDAQVIKIVERYAKKLEKSLINFPIGEKREEIQGEIDIVRSYLPKKEDERQILAAIDAIWDSTSERNFGALIKLVKEELSLARGSELIGGYIKQKIEKSSAE